jgi:hypothetical protein
VQRYRTRILAAVAAIGALVAAALIVVPARATPSRDTPPEQDSSRDWAGGLRRASPPVL